MPTLTWVGKDKVINHHQDVPYRVLNKEYTFTTKLLGKHNIYNSLASIIVLNKIGYSFEEINNVLTIVSGPKGRMENISYNNNNIIIDYAHTPDGIANVLNTAKELHPNKIITIVGCGGGTGSDRTKRSEMGNLVLSLSDKTIFTNDNPRDEDPNQIINDLLKEKINNNYIIELDRKKAINEIRERLAEGSDEEIVKAVLGEHCREGVPDLARLVLALTPKQTAPQEYPQMAEVER